MMKFYSFLTIIASVSLLQAQTQYQNSNFENWVNDPFTDTEIPVGWYGSANCDEDTCIAVIEKSTDAYSSNYAVKVSNTDSASGTMLTFLDGNPSVAFTGRPTSISGYYKYHKMGSDMGQVSAILYDANNESVGVATFFAISEVSRWTKFTASMQYMSTTEVSKMSIVVQASAQSAYTVGSYIMLDDFEFVYPVSNISDETQTSTSIYPMPADDVVYLPKDYSKQAAIYTTEGMLVREVTPNGNVLDVSDLASGSYMLKLNGESTSKYERLLKK